ncbi:MAG: histidine kinase [Flavobacterium sp.]|nr:MAG: histidine kinase [Flavobacterium sp.]
MLFVLFVFCTLQAQTQTESQMVINSQGPKAITRNIIQDGNGNIWIAAFDGIFKYDGKSFVNVTANVSAARFFSILQDRHGNFWFASVGAGVYRYDGKSFKNFTTEDGLGSDRVTHIYEDKSGAIWFGTENGASRYDGKSFRNLKMTEPLSVNKNDSVYVGRDSVHISSKRLSVSQDWTHNDVNAIIEDKAGKFWFATRGYARIYDGKTLTTITNNGKAFKNVRSMIKDKKGNIWLGGADGLWRYDGSTFTNFTQRFVGHIIEDKKGNVWTSSEINGKLWALSRYDGNSLSDKNPKVTEIATKAMIFGILEASDGSIWFGDLDGVHRYDGKTVTDFNESANKK